ncbi:PTS system, beta-glucoside-specific IIB component [Lachnospiraceae bacterium KM106-2]|nr:PTS system, beta-glucoside-specific IIB component [Lachnospiraceae bacterium KM106-2]
MVMSVIAGAIGGAIMGFGGVYGDAFANNGVLTIFTYAAFGMTKFIFYLVGIGVAFIGAAVLTYLVGFEEETEDVREEDIQPAESVTTILAPLAGQVIPLSEVGDEAFASGVLGQGAAIRPTKGEVVAPADCTVSVIYPSLHAVGLELVDGTELLIHVGIDTVKLEGRHFKKYVEAGDKIKKGSKIIGFDLDAIQKEGYDMATPVIVVDSEQIAAIVPHYGEADFADELFTIGRK